MRPPTQPEVKAQIALLRDMMPNIVSYSRKDTNNHEAMLVQIDVLGQNMPIKTITRRSEVLVPGNKDHLDANQTQAALLARAWLDGTQEFPPSTAWEGHLQSI